MIRIAFSGTKGEMWRAWPSTTPFQGCSFPALVPYRPATGMGGNHGNHTPNDAGSRIGHVCGVRDIHAGGRRLSAEAGDARRALQGGRQHRDHGASLLQGSGRRAGRQRRGQDAAGRRRRGGCVGGRSFEPGWPYRALRRIALPGVAASDPEGRVRPGQLHLCRPDRRVPAGDCREVGRAVRYAGGADRAREGRTR